MELLIVTLINLAVIAVIVQVTVSLNQDYKVLMSYLSSYIKGREMIDIISKDCRMAIRVLDSYGGYATTTSSIVLKVPSIDFSGNIIDVNSEFDYIIYRINNQDLWKTVIPGSASSRPEYDGALKKSIESLHIEYSGSPLSGIAHKSSITRLTLWVSVAEIILGKVHRINPGTTVKLMNYEWEFVR